MNPYLAVWQRRSCFSVIIDVEGEDDKGEIEKLIKYNHAGQK